MISNYIKKSAVRYFVVGLFVFNLTVLAVGLVVNRKYAASQATKATVLATNRTTCALRNLVQPTIDADRVSLRRYQSAADDTTAKPDARKRNAQRVIDTNVKIAGEVAFLNAYVTIPPGFDCSSLPKDSPA